VDAFKMVTFSDSQGNWPERLEDICDNGIIDKECTDGLPENCPDDVAAILIPGDLVSNGDQVHEWRDEFFMPCRNAFHYIPILPAIGNHDDPIQNYLDYFTLPENGEGVGEEEWYTVDYLNLRLITLNSDRLALAQFPWFANLLAATQGEAHIDFVITQFHHCCQSEVWPPGENIMSCLFVGSLEQFTADSGKPSAHLFGHTHAYSRGQSRDVPHFWVNVATSAGDIDYWGEYAQRDYDQFEVSYDEYGFSVLHFATGDEPSLRMVRRTGGDDENAYGYTDETILDDFSVTFLNAQPERPEAVYPRDVQVDQKAVTLLGSPFSDADGDFHLSSHWQVTETPGDYTDPVIDAWGNETRFQNIWGDEDTQAGADIAAYTANLQYDTSYSWRVRYRDEHFAWSEWSEEASFSVGSDPAWQAASISGADSFPGSRMLNSFILLSTPLGAVLLWKRLSRRKRSTLRASAS